MANRWGNSEKQWRTLFLGAPKSLQMVIAAMKLKDPCFWKESYDHPESESKIEMGQSCLTLCDPMDRSLPGSSVHGILQATVLEWVAISFSGDLPNPGIEPGSLALEADTWTSEPPGKPGRSNSLVIKPLDSGARYFGLKLHLHHLPVLFALDS